MFARRTIYTTAALLLAGCGLAVISACRSVSRVAVSALRCGALMEPPGGAAPSASAVGVGP